MAMFIHHANDRNNSTYTAWKITQYLQTIASP